MKFIGLRIFFLASCYSIAASKGIATPVTFRVTPDLTQHAFHVVMDLDEMRGDTIFLKMPAWTPGYYQLLHFADNVSNFVAVDGAGKPLPIVRYGRNGWKLVRGKSGTIRITYDVSAKRTFVANPFVTDDRAYISPPGVFFYVAGELNRPASLFVELPPGWKAATGLEPAGPAHFTSPNFDVLYDSPILMGELEELPSFDVRGIRHRFIGYKLGNFDRAEFMNGLKRIVEASVNLMDDIPYREYTFLAIGPGPGGIEHLNSTSFGFSGESLNTREGSIRMFTFLAHEYFHLYNVKRIRPVELGPFDYDKENRTNLLWVSEGFTVYYDLLLTLRAGLMTQEAFFQGVSSRIAAYENKPGKNFQSAMQASYNTWSDGPFGRTDDEVNKTVSVYDKGAALGLLMDMAIRNATGNRKSLDDVMRSLYKEFYKEKKRGFTESEFRGVAERVAGTSLAEVFNYASSTQPVDYPKFFSMAGLDIDVQPKALHGGWLGIASRERNDSLVVVSVDYESPAWKAGIRRGMMLAKPKDRVEPVVVDAMPDSSYTLRFGKLGEVKLILGVKEEASFAITPNPKATAMQLSICNGWLSGVN